MSKSWEELYEDRDSASASVAVVAVEEKEKAPVSDISGLPFTRWNEWNGGMEVICPMCGFEYTHIDQVVMLDSSGRTITVSPCGEDGVGEAKVRIGTHNEGGRRHTIRLMCYCENGHNWTIDFKQHKGNTGMTMIRHEDDD